MANPNIIRYPYWNIFRWNVESWLSLSNWNTMHQNAWYSHIHTKEHRTTTTTRNNKLHKWRNKQTFIPWIFRYVPFCVTQIAKCFSFIFYFSLNKITTIGLWIIFRVFLSSMPLCACFQLYTPETRQNKRKIEKNNFVFNAISNYRSTKLSMYSNIVTRTHWTWCVAPRKKISHKYFSWMVGWCAVRMRQMWRSIL